MSHIPAEPCRRALVAALGLMPVLAGMAHATPTLPTLDQVLDLCAATTIAEAAAKGDALGWGRSRADKLEAWRASFVAYNGGSVEVAGWRRGEQERDGLLSFWIARGPNGHRACTYSMPDPSGLLEALTKRFGEAKNLDRQSFATSASWRSGAIEIAYSAVGASALLNVSRPE